MTVPTSKQTAMGFLDATDLRFLLDDLRGGLSRTGISSLLASPVGSDYPAVLNGLREVLIAVERDTSPRGLALNGVRTLFAGDRLAAIQTCLESLPALLSARVQQTLAPQKVAVLRSLVRLPVPNFLDMFGRAMHENTNSSLLAWLLDPRTAPTIGPAALKALVERLDDGDCWQRRIESAARRDAISVRREYPIADDGIGEAHPGRIDIVVWGPDFVLAIENKILAREHAGQTNDYWDWLSGLRIAHAGLLLSPAGFPASSENFKAVSYLQLLACLLEGPVRGRLIPEEELVLASYVKTLAAGLLRTELRSISQREESS